MFSVRIKIGNRHAELRADEEILISDLFRKNRIDLVMPCGGNRTCGKCRVLVSGSVSPMTEEEAAFLTPERRRDGMRLACFTKVTGDAEIIVPSAGKSMQILELQGGSAAKFDPPCHSGYGVAVDIGTTTVVMYIYRLTDGELLSVKSGMNVQRAFGADVISRISYSDEHSVLPLRDAICEQISQLYEEAVPEAGIDRNAQIFAVITGNTTMLHLLCGLDPHGIAVAPFAPQSLFGGEEPSLSCLFGKNARVHLPKCIGSYIGADITCSVLASGMMNQNAALLIDLGTNGEMALKYNGKLFCCSTAAGPAFEGAGLYMGMTAAEGAIARVWNENGVIQYLVIGDPEKQIIDNTDCAGENITAEKACAVGILGDASDARDEDDISKLAEAMHGQAKGICGSGIIDAVAAFLELGLIDETGRIDVDSPHYEEYGTLQNGAPALKVGASGVVVTGKDIREVQLAKSAVMAGILTLLSESGCRPEEVETLYLAGGFGNYIQTGSAVRVGLFPKELEQKTRPIGNAAGQGASMYLLSKQTQEDEKNVTASAAEIELSSNPAFMDYYVEQMMFPQE